MANRLGDVLVVSTAVVTATMVVYAIVALAMTSALTVFVYSAEAFEKEILAPRRGVCDHLCDPVDAVKAHLAYIETAVIMFKMEHKRLPETLNDLLIPPMGESHLQDEAALFDRWGTELAYRVGAKGDFEVVSYGEDGTAGGEGINADISSKRER